MYFVWFLMVSVVCVFLGFCILLFFMVFNCLVYILGVYLMVLMGYWVICWVSALAWAGASLYALIQ